MVIMWPGEHGIMLSQRQASGHVAPSVVSDPPRVAILLDASYSNQSRTSMSFSVPASDKKQEDLIWAFSKTQPRGVDAALSQHIWSGYGQIDFDKQFEEVQNATPVLQKTALRNGMPTPVLVAHIVIGVMVTMFLLPGGIVVPRIVRGLTTSKLWFPVHIAVQGGLSLLFLLISMGTGSSFKGTPSTHRGLGIALFVFFMIQCILGIVVHFVMLSDRFKCTFRTRRGRGPSNLLHYGFGIVCVALGWATCWTGFVNQWPQRGHGYSAYGLRVGWGIMFMFWVIAYVLALYFFLPRQLHLEAEERTLQERDQKKYFPSSLEKGVAPVTPRPPEPTQFSPPPSPSLIPISAQWFRQENPGKRASGKRLSDLQASGMPSVSVVPHVASRERLDSVITYEGSLSRQQSEESMQSRFAQSRRSS